MPTDLKVTFSRVGLSTFAARVGLLVASLVVLSVVGSLVPALGLLTLTLVIVITLELTKVRFEDNYLAVAFVALSTMALIWGWLGPYISIFARPGASVMLFSWGVYCLRIEVKPSKTRITSASVVMILMGLVVTIANSKQVLPPLLWGYDNSAHLPALSQVYRHHGFLYSGKLPQDFTFSNYVNGYPPLTSGTWAFLMSVGNLKLNGGYQIIKYFAFFHFLSGILVVALVAKNWSVSLQSWIGNLIRFPLLVALALILSFSQIGFAFWAGFPPFIWTCCLIIAILLLLQSQVTTTTRVGIVTLGFVLVNYSYPLLSPVIILVGIHELTKMRKSDLMFFWENRRKVAAFGVAAIILTLVVVLKSLNVRHYLNDGGGIQPIEIRNLIVVFLVVVLGLLSSGSHWRTMSVIHISFAAALVNFMVLALLSNAQQGSISYYPQKAGYLALILGFCSLGSLTNVSSQAGRGKFKSARQIIILASAFLAIWFSVSSSTNPQFAKYGFISTSIVWENIRNSKPNMSGSCLIRGMELTKDLNSHSDATTILYLNEDLGTRWINGIRGRLTDATYSLSIPIGMAQKPLTEIVNEWLEQYPKSRLLVLSEVAPAVQMQHPERISYRNFSCN